VATLRGTVPLWTPETPVRTDRSSESDHRFARCPACKSWRTLSGCENSTPNVEALFDVGRARRV